jgi:SAM-dependent methyltransferase
MRKARSLLEIRHEYINDYKDLQRSYDDIYSGKGIQQCDSFYLWVINLLKPVPGRLLIDISCGQGRLPILARQKGIQAIGIDFSTIGLVKGRSSCRSIPLVSGNGEKLPIKDASVDYITHIGNLEHYINPSLGAQEVFRVLKPGGLACILLPNAFGLLGNFIFVALHGEIFDDGQPLQRYATRHCWETMLIDAGLIIQQVMGWEGVEFQRTWFDTMRIIKNPQKILKLIIQPLIPINLASHLVFLCTRD